MSDLKTVRLKPNPPGKDRARCGGVSQIQLGAEWVDIKNVGQGTVDVTGVRLYHVAYSGPTDRTGTWEEITGFSKGALGVGQVVRVHSGSGPENILRHEDRVGADYHIFSGKDRYVWNNDRSDRSGIGRSASTLTDQAWYEANPFEGKVLQRVGDKLTPLANSAVG